ncbi:extracellular solute-binding protein [Treponema parvum]|uniref:Extracellular solute-binding protein n=1 Tax=Treponema parvum TaxID=138851 RepID=A0A975IDA0_9SPIR|nr:extracellular solute-binding protein [Treponema parvum]QTQ12612.1 extracellular solute-binding protein [Treponema parvum]
MKKLLTVILTLFFAGALVFAAGDKDTSSQKDSSGLGTKLVLYSSMTEFDLEALLSCFNEKYPNINVEVVSGAAGEFVARIKAEANNPQGDVTWGGLCDSDGDRYSDLFEHWVSDETKYAMEGYSTPNGFYSMDHLSTVCFCVNTELEAKLGMKITSYADLLDPRLKGKIVLSNPNSSSAAWNNLCNIFSVFGYDTPEAWNYMEKLMANLIVVKSSSVCFNSVHDGEYVVGLTYEDGAVKLLQNGAKNIRVQYPDEGTSAAAYGVAVIKNAPHMAAAKAFADFICSAEGQTAVAKYMEGTLRLTNRNYKIPSGAWLKASSDIKWVNRPVKKVTDGKTEMLDKWNTLWARISK